MANFSSGHWGYSASDIDVAAAKNASLVFTVKELPIVAVNPGMLMDTYLKMGVTQPKMAFSSS